MHFQCNRCVLNRSPNVSTKFGEDRPNSKKWRPCFKIQDGGGRHLELWLLRFFAVADVFLIKVAIFLLTLVMIDQIVRNGKRF